MRAPYDGYVIRCAPGETPSMAHTLGEEAELLRAILRALATHEAPQEAATRLVDRREAAAMFGVSVKTLTRWVKPTSQTRKRGRAWYDPADVERQLRALGPALKSPKATATTTTRAKKRTARPTQWRTEPSTDARIDAIEQRLKDGAAGKTPRG